jgi:hypothetical protein
MQNVGCGKCTYNWTTKKAKFMAAICVYVCVNMCTCACTCVLTIKPMCVYVYICVYAHVRVYLQLDHKEGQVHGS